MFAIGYRALDQALSEPREVEEQSRSLIAVQQAMRIIEQDFELLQPRPVRNLIGDGYLPAHELASASSGIGSLGSQATGSSSNFSSNHLSSSSFSSTLSGATPPLVTFTRGGWTNPVGIQRTELQRVSYTIENGALMRSYYPVLDATESGATDQAHAGRSRQEFQPALHGCRP